MEDHENPYTILGVSVDASESEIKKAYRKLALKHHPDKQSTEEGRKQATVVFAKISNAYEILGDASQRANYDREAAMGAARANRPWSKMPRRSNSQRGGQQEDDFFHHMPFHDPFSVFESFFRSEGFGDDFFSNFHHSMYGTNNRQNINNNRRRSPFDDPFFGGGRGSLFNDPFFGGGGMGGSMFGNDPFFGGGGMMGGPSMLMGGGGGGDIFSSMNQQMNNMMNMHQQQQQIFNGRGPQQQQSVVYSSSSSSNLMGGGPGITHSTTTRIINGKRQTVTERIVRNADGTVERHVESSGDDDFPGQAQHRLDYNQDTRRQALPPPESARRRESSGSRNDKSKNKRSLFKRKRRNSANETAEE